MKPLLTTQSSIEFNSLFKTFNQTHEPADLEKLLTCCCQYPDIHRLTVMTLFLRSIKGKKFIKQELHTRLLYSFALQMISLISNKEKKSDTEPALLTQQIKLFIRDLLLKLMITGLYICLQYPDLLTVVSNLKLNTFSMISFFHDDSRYRCLATTIDSKKIYQFLDRMPQIIHPEHLSIVNSLLSDNPIYYQIWGRRAKVTVSTNHSCGKVIRRILQYKFVPMIL
jgi:hypothetical protein